MFEGIIKFFKNMKKHETKEVHSKDQAKDRLHLVLMQDRANVSADFLEMMKQEIIDVIKKYIEVEEDAIDVRLTNEVNEDGTTGIPSLYANIPIKNIRSEMKKEVNDNKIKDKEEKLKEKPKEISVDKPKEKLDESPKKEEISKDNVEKVNEKVLNEDDNLNDQNKTNSVEKKPEGTNKEKNNESDGDKEVKKDEKNKDDSLEDKQKKEKK